MVDDYPTEAPPHFPSNTATNQHESIDLEGMEDPFGEEDCDLQERKLKVASPYNSFDTYRLKRFIFKSNDDLR